MKKIIYLVIAVFLFSILNYCGYQPIYTSKKINIKIVNHYLEGENNLAQRVYTKLNSILITSDNAQEVSATISASSIKSITSKDAAGKALEYKITMNAGLKITDIFSEQVLINENISLSENFKVQSQIYETERVENKIISNLVDRSSQQFMLRISQRNLVK